MVTNLFWGLFCIRQKLPPSLLALTFQNKMQYRYVNARIKHSMNASTSCENVVRIGSVTSEFKKGVCEIFAKIKTKKLGKNWHIPPNISATIRPIFTELSAMIVTYVRIIKLALVLQFKGRCYGNQLILGAFQMSKLTASTLRSGILKRNALSLCECMH